MPLPYEYKDLYTGRELRKRAANGALTYGEVLCCSSLESNCPFKLEHSLTQAPWCRCTM